MPEEKKVFFTIVSFHFLEHFEHEDKIFAEICIYYLIFSFLPKTIHMNLLVIPMFSNIRCYNKLLHAYFMQFMSETPSIIMKRCIWFKIIIHDSISILDAQGTKE